MTSFPYKAATAVLLVLLAQTGESFFPHQTSRTKQRAPPVLQRASVRAPAATTRESDVDMPYYVNIKQEANIASQAAPVLTEISEKTECAMSKETSLDMKKSSVAPRKVKKAGAAHKEGIFSPVVMAAKVVMGEENLNKMRGDVIALHSDVIKGFVATSETRFGQSALARLFAIADKNDDGKLDKDEVAYALQKLGFSWLKAKQVTGIMKRADLDENGTIEFDEFVKEAPKTLKTNLVKLAKKNGGELGFLV